MLHIADRLRDLRQAAAATLAALLLSAAAAVPAADPVPPAATLPPQAADRAALALEAARARHAPLALFAPTAFPEALSVEQATDVRFTVLLTGGAASTQSAVTLFVSGLDTTVQMQDDGLGPDLSAGDRIYSASVHFSATDATAGSCYDARVTALSAAGQTVLSGATTICVTRFPIGIAASDLSASNIVTVVDGGTTARAVADEALIRVRPGLGDDRIDRIAGVVGGTIVGSLPREGLYQIRLSSPQTGEGLEQTLQKLRRTGGVLFAAPNEVGALATPPVNPVPTSDPMLASQTWLDRLNAKRGWAITKGDPSMTIAVIDSGVDFDHSDFWATPAGTASRFSNDGTNLLAADCTGGSCVAVSKALTCHATNSCNTSNAATDTFGHGTLVHGFVGAYTDNTAGIAGATWQPHLLNVRAAVTGSVTAGNVAQSINYARGQGARILSISAVFSVLSVGTLCPSVADADATYGRLVVAAAGNDGATTTNYPAGCTCTAGGIYPAACSNPTYTGQPTATPVANSEVNGSNQDVIHTGTLASNYGSWIKLSAPGTNVVSTARAAAACGTCDATYTSDPLTPGYRSVIGTSFSTPLASGMAALVLARSPSTTNAALRTVLYSTGVALTPVVASESYIHRIDVLAALLTFNTAPTAINLSGLCIPENTNTTVATSVGTLTTVDADAGLTGFEYAVVGGADAAKFSIGGVNGDQLRISDGILDFETKPSYSVTVRTTDVGNAPFDQPLIVAVCNINEPPVVAPTATFSIPENSPNATVVDTIVATDPEGVAPTFTITGGTGVGVFAISGTGQITVTNSLALDFETTPSFTLNVNVSDGMTPVPVVVTINLTDVNEPPTITGGTFSIVEHSANGTTVGTIAASDPEGVLTLSITPLSNTGGAFAISNTGEITVANSAALDFATTPVFTLTVMATAFLAALAVIPAQTQDFSAFVPGTLMNNVPFMPGVSATHNRGLQIFDSSVGRVLFWVTTGPTATSAYDITISLTYHAFGFDVAAFNPATGPGTMQVFFQNGQTTSVPVSNTTGSEDLPVFFGVISSSPVTQVIWNEPLEVGGTECCEETALDNFVANP